MPSSRRRARTTLWLVASIAAAVDVRRCTRPRLLSRRALPGAVAACTVAGRAAASDLLDVCPNCDQPVDALPLATIRGKWALDAQWSEDGLPRALRGTVAFRSLGDPNRGRCTFSSDTIKGSGSWAEKPARIRKGQFTWSARWRLLSLIHI